MLQKLIAFDVPWQVSPSTSFLRLHAGEVSDDAPTSVTFVGHFANRRRSIAVGDATREGITAVANPYEAAGKSEQRSVYAIVEIEFLDASRARMEPAHSDREVLDPARFDRSRLRVPSLTLPVDEYLREYRRVWASTGNCPDPGAYSVRDSIWIGDLGIDGAAHFVVRGHDAYVELIARGWRWRELGDLPASW